MNYEKKAQKKKKTAEEVLIDLVFSWSIKDVLNNNLYKYKVKEIPMKFSSMEDYLKSFIDPLVEEVHADLSSSMKNVYQAPSSRIMNIKTSKDFKLPHDLNYQIITLQTDKRNEKNNVAGYNNYEPMNGDLIAITDVKPRSLNDLLLPGRFYVNAFVKRAKDDGTIFVLSIRSSKPIPVEDNLPNQKGITTLYALCLTNMFTNIRIWKALHSGSEENMKIIQSVLRPKFVDVAQCSLCSNQEKCPNLSSSRTKSRICSSDLNESQQAAVLSCIAMKDCHHLNSVKLIWGPPGTGKTKTIGFLLHSLYVMKCRTLTCAPTNTAVLEVTERLLKKVTESFEYDTYGLGDVVLFGNAERMKIDERDDLLDIFLNHRADILSECFGSMFGWKGSLVYVISLLKNPIDPYLMYLKDWMGGNNIDEDKEEDKNGDKEDNETERKKAKKKMKDEISQKKKRSKRWKKVIAETLEESKNIKKDIKHKSEHEEEEEEIDNGSLQNKKKQGKKDKNCVPPLTFAEFVRRKFNLIGKKLVFHIVNLYKHLPTRFISVKLVRKMIRASDSLKHFLALLQKFTNEELEVYLKNFVFGTKSVYFKNLNGAQDECLNILRLLPQIFPAPDLMDKEKFRAFVSLQHFLALLQKFTNGELKFYLENSVLGTESDCFKDLNGARHECLCILRLLPQTFPIPDFENIYEIRDFCLSNACLIFCTVSSSAKLHKAGISPIELLVIDEAAQLKECESTIPLQLPDIRHAILIGDERQLPAMVISKISEEADFGRSLFERLVLLGHEKRLLDVQHRMHQSISLFPNREFYGNQIMNGMNVKLRSYTRHFLEGKMFGSYSFINVTHGKEDFDDKRSLKNMVEAAVVSEIVSRLYKECTRTKKKVRVGVISPYKAQVFAIQEKVKEYSTDDDGYFSISVRSVDGFQGGEEDVIIISTVRCNAYGNVGFLSNHQRSNVALTRARHCLWILGNESTLIKSGSIWKKLVIDAMERKCFFNVDEDTKLTHAIAVALLELKQINILPHIVPHLFRNTKWKVCFDDAFWRSMAKVGNNEICKEVLSMLEKLSIGWRQTKKTNHKKFFLCKSSSLVLESYRVTKQISLVWSTDVLCEASHYIQVLKIWEISTLSDLPRLEQKLDKIVFESYPKDKINRCKYQNHKGDFVVPMRWPVDMNCIEDDAVESLSKPLASLSLLDKSETSSSSYRYQSKSQKSRYDMMKATRGAWRVTQRQMKEDY